MTERQVVEFAWDMAISRAEFDRCLPDAVARVPYRVQGNRYSHDDGVRAWSIALSPQPDRVIALLRLPRHRVEFHLEGYADAERETWIERFSRYFQRGGG